MSLESELEKLVEMKVNEKLKSIEATAFLLKPWFKIDSVAQELDGKSRKWVRDTFCSDVTGNELKERKETRQ